MDLGKPKDFVKGSPVARLCCAVVSCRTRCVFGPWGMKGVHKSQVGINPLILLLIDLMLCCALHFRGLQCALVMLLSVAMCIGLAAR